MNQFFFFFCFILLLCSQGLQIKHACAQKRNAKIQDDEESA